ncbi:hypothetical protein Ancab_014982, partial [Ancistrocladus abbreviatus]
NLKMDSFVADGLSGTGEGIKEILARRWVIRGALGQTQKIWRERLPRRFSEVQQT